ncbi:unnamed protein product [Heterobilharzia americana]|nr:unnamed protein product [Heterobilharzia americana]
MSASYTWMNTNVHLLPIRIDQKVDRKAKKTVYLHKYYPLIDISAFGDNLYAFPVPTTDDREKCYVNSKLMSPEYQRQRLDWHNQPTGPPSIKQFNLNINVYRTSQSVKPKDLRVGTINQLTVPQDCRTIEILPTDNKANQNLIETEFFNQINTALEDVMKRNILEVIHNKKMEDIKDNNDIRQSRSLEKQSISSNKKDTNSINSCHSKVRRKRESQSLQPNYLDESNHKSTRNRS